MQPDTRHQILSVALRHFVDKGYAGASIQEIVDEAQVAKPTLYYYFESKAALYQALIDQAHDERFRRMQTAAESVDGLSKKLEAMLTAVFDFIREHRELVRLAFASVFAAPGEVPIELAYKEKCQRNFDFIQNLMQSGLSRGELDPQFTARELTIAWYGLMNIYVMGKFFQPDLAYDAKTVRGVVNLFLCGAGAKLDHENSAARDEAEKVKVHVQNN